MNPNFIDRKKFFIVDKGLYIIFITAIITLTLLYCIQFNGTSILENVINYYFDRQSIEPRTS